MSGHAGASVLPEVTAVADVAHLGAMAVWLGGLVTLFAFLLRQAKVRELLAILPVWSRWAARAVGVLVLAGVVQALVEISTLRDLIDTTYGRLILVKIGVLELIVLVAAYSRRLARVTTPAAMRAGRERLRRSVLLELGGAVVVLAAAAILVQTTPARTVDAGAPAQDPGQFSTNLTSPLYQLEVDLAPARTGANEIHLYAATPTGGAIKILEWQGTAALPDQGIEPAQVPLVKITDDHAIGQVQFPLTGTWNLRFTLRTTDVDEATVTATVQVRR